MLGRELKALMQHSFRVKRMGTTKALVDKKNTKTRLTFEKKKQKNILMISKTEKIFCGLTRQDKKKNVLEGLSHVTCDVNVRTKHDDND